MATTKLTSFYLLDVDIKIMVSHQKNMIPFLLLLKYG